MEGNWKEMKGKVKEKWGKLTDDDLTAINGKTRSTRRRTAKTIWLCQGSGEAGHRYLVFDAALSAVETVRVSIRREITIALSLPLATAPSRVTVAIVEWFAH
jgi:hypothetical protein